MAKWMRWMPRNPAAVLRGLVGGIASLQPSPPDEDGPRPDVDGGEVMWCPRRRGRPLLTVGAGR